MYVNTYKYESPSKKVCLATEKSEIKTKEFDPGSD